MQEENDYSIFPETTPVTYAPFWWRFGASFIDGLILIIPNFLLVSFLNGGRPYGLGNIASVALYWLYSALQESGANQATIGKKAVGIKVVNEEGGRISFGQATGRHFGKIISFLILLIGYLMMIWNSRKQTLHDKLARTFVVLK